MSVFEGTRFTERGGPTQAEPGAFDTGAQRLASHSVERLPHHRDQRPRPAHPVRRQRLEACVLVEQFPAC